MIFVKLDINNLFKRYLSDVFILKFLKKVLSKIWSWNLLSRIDKLEKEVEFLKLKEKNIFLKKAKGVIHVGANTGQERNLYDHYSKNVLWFEPIPSIYKKLQENLKHFPNQKAYKQLVTDKDKKLYDFYITNNYASSSIFELKLHRSMWPMVKPLKKINIESITIDTFFYEKKINISKFDTLIMDTQGSELLVLRGAEKTLKNIKYIKTEAADYESYKDCCQLKDIDKFLSKRGFKMIFKDCFFRHEVGNYYDVLFAKDE